MKKMILGALLPAALFFACQSAEEDNTSSTQSPSTTLPATAVQPGSTPAAVAPAAVPAPPATTALPASPATAPVATAAPKVNPAHGMPGHRCDIQVGAPLPAAGTASAAQVVPAGAPTQAGPVIQNIVPQAPAANPVAPVSGSKRVNPAHGQPGHRCDIAVGAPLN